MVKSRLIDVVVTDAKLYLIFEYLPYDLFSYINEQEKAKTFTVTKKKKIFYQIVKSVAYLHSRRILHRDLKPQNILVTQSGEIKVADFGLARQYTIPIRNYTHEIVTVWYRAPEVLLGAKEYSTSIDIWSLGCILAEFYTNEPLFPGDSEIGQLYRIFQVLGTPTEEQWKGVSKLKEYKDIFPKWRQKDLKTICPGLDDDGVDLLKKLLTYDPVKRISSKEALNHPYFKNVVD